MNPDLAAWDAVCRQSVIGRVGHRLTQAPGPAYCTLGIPWATSAGVNLRLLHGAYAARRVSEARILDSSAYLVTTRQRGRLLRLSGRGTP